MGMGLVMAFVVIDDGIWELIIESLKIGHEGIPVILCFYQFSVS